MGNDDDLLALAAWRLRRGHGPEDDAPEAHIDFIDWWDSIATDGQHPFASTRELCEAAHRAAGADTVYMIEHRQLEEWLASGALAEQE